MQSTTTGPMHPPQALTTPGTADAPAAFPEVLCALDGGEDDRHAATQAATLAAGGGSVSSISIAWGSTAIGLDGAPVYAPGRAGAAAALDQACGLAMELGVPCIPRLVEHPEPTPALLEAAIEQELLVVGCRGRTGARGFGLGSTATAAVHHAEPAVLLARRSPGVARFPERIVVASDGSPGSRAAARLAARIARRHRSFVLFVDVADGDDDAERRHAQAEDAATIFDLTGEQPLLVAERGPAHNAIAATARAHGASLIVVGSRGLGRAQGVGSVSERLAHAAPCSVLLARPH